ncbi:MAG: hypothetical protein MUD00_02190 [Candidatus Pacebacteria bacterium]|jgi:hypothetical protein|nr:hypothetical protein [Candidatus Paceibacterota bacterium]
MHREELISQYDRYIDQVRTEARDLYWLYNFFFVIDSALLGAVFIQKLAPGYMVVAQVAGILMSLYWFAIIRKQRMWRNNWVERIQMIEQELGYEERFHMWGTKRRSRHLFREYVIGKRGLWRFLFLLPIGFVIIWTGLALGIF